MGNLNYGQFQVKYDRLKCLKLSKLINYTIRIEPSSLS